MELSKEELIDLFVLQQALLIKHYENKLFDFEVKYNDQVSLLLLFYLAFTKV